MPTKTIGFSLFSLSAIYLFFFLIPSGNVFHLKHLANVIALFISGIGLFFYKKP